MDWFVKQLLFLFILLLIGPRGLVLGHQESLLTIELTDGGFVPNKAEISQGEVVVFGNIDIKGNAHWPASNIHPTHGAYPEFDPKKPILPGQSWRFTFDKPGVWRFHDHLNPEFTGEVVVKEKGRNMGFRLTAFADLKSRILAFIEKVYFRAYPQKLEERLRAVNFVEAAESPEESSRWLRILGLGKTLQEFKNDLTGEIYGCHDNSHLLGKAAYRVFGPAVFREDATFCHAGFYHGAIEVFLREREGNEVVSVINEICSGQETENEQFSCFHGFGHGIMAYLDYDLPEALDECTKLPGEGHQIFCYDGVFMENTFAGMGLGGVSGHQTAWISEDFNFPCNSISQDYRIQLICLRDQVDRMNLLFGYDFAKTGKECLRQEFPEMRKACFDQIGQDAANENNHHPEKTIAACGRLPENYFTYCIQGAISNIIAFWGRKVGEQPHLVCRKLEEYETKSACYKGIGKSLFSIFGNEREKITENCRYALGEAEDFEKACREGALGPAK